MIAQRLPLITIHRIALHTVLVKRPEQECSDVDHDEDLLELTEAFQELLIKRLIDATGKQSKAFTVELARSEAGTFFGHCQSLKDQSREEFLATSCQLASLLASTQRRNQIPGGYFLLIDCTDRENNLGQYIVIKAEPDSGVIHSRNGKVSKVDVLKQIMFSSAQKLFKIGMLFERSEPLNEGNDPNDQYECLLFDNQFSSDTRPAEYFYRDFLSYSIDRNAKIQTQRFSQLTEEFIFEHVKDSEVARDVLNALRVEIKSQENIISPMTFGQRYLATDELRDRYTSQVVNDLPSAIQKDTKLIDKKYSKRRIGFSNDIILTGPDEGFDEKVHVLEPGEEFDRNDDRYTYIRVTGQPYKRR